MPLVYLLGDGKYSLKQPYLCVVIAQIRNSTFLRVLWGLYALYLLNISVDTADPMSNFQSEDLSFNDQESVVEIVVEKFLGYEHAIIEYDDPESEGHNQEKQNRLDLTLGLNKTLPQSAGLCFYPLNPPLNFAQTTTDGFYGPISPPPKV